MKPITIKIENPLQNAPKEIVSPILKLALTTSEKPTNTTFACVQVSQQWLNITKELMQRDIDVLNAFKQQFEQTKSEWNLLWRIKINIFLKKNLENYTNSNEQAIEKQINELITYLPNFKEIITHVCSKIDCDEKITHIEFGDFLKFLLNASYVPSNCTKLARDIFLTTLRNLEQDHSYFVALALIGTELDMAKNKGLNISIPPVIKKFGDYLVNQNSSLTYQEAYFNVLKKFFDALSWKHNPNVVSSNIFDNLSIKFIQLFFNCGKNNDYQCILQLIYLLSKSSNSKIVEIISSLFNEFKKNDRYFNFENILKLPISCRSFFLQEGINCMPFDKKVADMLLNHMFPDIKIIQFTMDFEKRLNLKASSAVSQCYIASFEENFEVIKLIYKKISAEDKAEVSKHLKTLFEEIFSLEVNQNLEQKTTIQGCIEYLSSL